MKICYFFLKSKKDLGGRKILFTLWAFSKSQRVEEYKGQTPKKLRTYCSLKFKTFQIHTKTEYKVNTPNYIIRLSHFSHALTMN